ncbi:MAG TPA: Pycsar system effector family protein [Croceibacterium sp.]|nr:Pycsar system effector family protein [Croceibacterium sp.]
MATAPAPKIAARKYSPDAIHLLRTAQLNNVALSRMADQKASILMGATFVVFSLTVGRTLSGALSYPLLLLGGFAFASTLCAVAAVMPSLGAPAKTAEGMNRLFFGHFARLDEAEWTESVLDDLQTDEGTFRMMLHDIHQHGSMLLHRKYRFLGYAYRVFVAGLILTLVAFAVEKL